MRVALLHPEWDRSCELCERFLVKDDGTVAERAGLPVLRPKGTPTPCAKCEKVPLSARKRGLDWTELRKLAVELTEQNRAAWRFYRECRAVGHFPDDAVVRWYSVILKDIEEEAARQPLERLTATVAAMIAIQAAGKRK